MTSINQDYQYNLRRNFATELAFFRLRRMGLRRMAMALPVVASIRWLAVQAEYLRLPVFTGKCGCMLALDVFEPCNLIRIHVITLARDRFA